MGKMKHENYSTSPKIYFNSKIYILKEMQIYYKAFCVLNQFVNFLIAQCIVWWGQIFNSTQDWTKFKTQKKEYGVKWKK